MNGKTAKKLRKLAPLLLLDVYKNAEAHGADLSNMPTVRQVYRKLKHKYTRGL